MFGAILLTTAIILPPADGYIGKLHMLESCTFAYHPGTTLSAGTGISTDQYAVTYGKGTILPPGAGIQCDVCYLKSITSANGVAIFNCDMKYKEER